jgi:hypothetical protein
MGHKTIAMTLRYSHLSPAHKLEAVQRLTRQPTGTTTGTGGDEVRMPPGQPRKSVARREIQERATR